MELTLHVPPDSRTDPEYDSFTLLNLIRIFKALANKDTLSRTHCCRHKCLPVCLRAQHLLRTQILCPGLKKNVSNFVQKHFVSTTNVSQFAQPKKHHGQQCVRNNVTSFTRAFKASSSSPTTGKFLTTWITGKLFSCYNFRSVVTERQSFTCSGRETIFFLDS